MRSMLTELLQMLQTSDQALTVSDLSRRMQVEPAVLEDLIAFWVRKGRISDGVTHQNLASVCTGGSACTTCGGAQTCAFVARVPKSYALTNRNRGDVL